MTARRLLTGPVGPGSTFSVLALAEEAGRAGRRHALVLPTRPAMEHARNELARRTGSCDPRAVFTFSGLARHLLGPTHPRPATARERDWLLVLTLRALRGPERDLGLRFRGFRQGLLHVFDEVEQAGLSTVRELQAALRRARMDEPRAERLVSTYQGWREALARARLATEADLLHQAAQALARGKATAPALLLVDGFTDLTHRQQELLAALALRAEEVVVTCPVADPAAPTGAFTAPDRMRKTLRERLGFVEAPRAPAPDPRPPALRRLATHLFAPRDEAAAAVDPEGLTVVRAASRRDEVELALARAREFVAADPTRRWTDVLLVVPDVRRYRRTLEQVGRELGVPVRVRGPVALSGAPIVQAALAFLRAAATLELPPLLVAAASPALGLTPDEADRLGRAARRQGLPATGDERPWRDLARELGGAPGAFVERALALGLDLRRQVARDPSTAACGRVREALERHLRPVSPATLDARPTPEAVAEAAEEVAARRALLELLADLERLAVPLGDPPGDDDESAEPPPVTPARLAARVEEEVRATEVTPVDRRRHVLHAVDLREARAWEADLVLVLGLVDGEVPRAGRDDLFLPEGTRRALTGRRAQGRAGVNLRTAQHRAQDEAFLFYAAVTRARRELWLLYPGFTPSGTPRAPSRFLDEVQALVGAEAWAACARRRTPSDLVADDPALLLTRPALRRFAYRRVAQVARTTGPEAEKVQLGVAVLDALLEREDELARAAVALTRPDAALRRPLGARALDRVYSASELEAYATCPYKHFVHYLLGAQREDDLAQQGLDARRQGMILHGALEQVYDQGLAVEEALERAFARHARGLDIGLEEEAFRRRALVDLRAFVGEDDPAFRRRAGLTPHRFELRFGPEAEAGALVVEAPELGGQVRLKGSIDRIDVAPPPPPAEDADPATPPARRAAFVTDYKLGGREVDARYLDGMHQGERLQLPVYLLALDHVFDLEPLGAAFAALGTRRRTGVVEPAVGAAWERAAGDDEGRVRLHKLPLRPALRRAEEHIKRIVAGISHGVIEPAPRDAAECTRCDARDVCRMEPWEARRRARRGRALPNFVAPRPAAAAP
ncbi:MAG: PD-(D/E)XK nuclease family protein [Planctomycetes bacterium]|nr:PD-(D/E)XK nuclease family protein [Planctomycetota bacterium]